MVRTIPVLRLPDLAAHVPQLDGTMMLANGQSCDVVEYLPYTEVSSTEFGPKIGLIVLASDYTIEHEFRHVFSMPGISLYQARIENVNEITPLTLAAMETRIADTLRLILPQERLDIVAYACTSASTVLGEQVVFDQIAQVQPNAACTTPITAAFAAFNAFSAKKIAVLTPYRRDVNKILCDYITQSGYQVGVLGSFNQALDPVVARIDESSIISAMQTLVHGRDIDMVFVSCTSIRLLESIHRIETLLDMPVTSSNHAMAWHCLRMAGVSDVMPQLGRLYSKALV